MLWYKEPTVEQLENFFKACCDGLSITVTVGALSGVLPDAAALGSLVWTLIRTWETKTVQGWVRRLRGHAPRR